MVYICKTIKAISSPFFSTDYLNTRQWTYSLNQSVKGVLKQHHYQASFTINTLHNPISKESTQEKGFPSQMTLLNNNYTEGFCLTSKAKQLKVSDKHWLLLEQKIFSNHQPAYI